MAEAEMASAASAELAQALLAPQASPNGTHKAGAGLKEAVPVDQAAPSRKRQRSPEPSVPAEKSATPPTTAAATTQPAPIDVPAPEIPPAVQALTTTEHWATITAHMPAFPSRLAQFLNPLHGTDSTEGNDDTEREPKYKVDRFQPDRFPKARGFLAHIAVMENDLPVLQLLFEAQKVLQPIGLATQKFSFDDVLRCAVTSGRLELLKWLVETLPTDANWRWEPELMKAALKRATSTTDDHDQEISGVDLLEWLHSHCPKDSLVLGTRDVDMAMGSGSSMQLAKWLHDHEYVFSGKAMDIAATSGNLDIVQFLHTNRPEGCTHEAMNGAVGNGHLDVVRFLHEHRTEGCSTQAMDRAAKNGHLSVVKFLHEHRQEGCTVGALDGAAGNGHLEVITFLHEHRKEGCSTKAMDVAADNGLLNVLQFLQTHRNEGFSSNRVVKWSAKNTFLELIQFLHPHLPKSGWSEAAMDAAAAAGRLDVVTFLHEHRSEGCTTRAMDNAAKMGHLEVVKFLHENRTEGCSIVALMQAMEKGHEDVVKFLYMHRYKDNAPRSL
ncbi:hypothetical protein Gpo141_00010119 [Globisporangium polare]